MHAEPVESFEGRLNAHRRLLVSLLSIMSADPQTRDALQALLNENEAVSDHEEDPGIEPGEAFAIQAASNAEIASILRDAMARA
ncbi:hypothetical protein [Pararhizobium sp.]|uniref:hypothetical protein n=1 Tax=Pararhizobium sp. TaxID=1977563 RepID=UPI002722CACE|nr:hypothetical protein [Pararhizobium sp.]MDO9416365.1 hypothetical protein [Pararhizobium sp.]